ncbi:MAG: hypothetical protein ACFFB0_09655 [Promethearchaeota archaeon]
MIEAYNNKDKLISFVDGTKYLNKKKKMVGYLKKNKYKDKSGTTLLILKENGDITWSEGETQGYFKENKIFSSYDDNVVFEFRKDKGIILNSTGETLLYLKGDIEKLVDLDFFGITSQFLELFA